MSYFTLFKLFCFTYVIIVSILKFFLKKGRRKYNLKNKRIGILGAQVKPCFTVAYLLDFFLKVKLITVTAVGGDLGFCCSLKDNKVLLQTFFSLFSTTLFVSNQTLSLLSSSLSIALVCPGVLWSVFYLVWTFP